jgi:hypothetical protein
MSDIDEKLRWQLRGLRRDIEPGRELWPDIAARIATKPAAASNDGARPRSRVPEWLPMALAASLLLAVGAFWRFGAAPAASGDPLIRHEAAAMSRHYENAFAELAKNAPEQAQDASAYAAAIRDLDRSATQIRAAIERDPDSRFLLDRLHRTYARKLALIQRADLT